MLNEQNMELLGSSLLLDTEVFEISGKTLTDDEMKKFERYQKTKSKLNNHDKKPISLKQKELNSYFSVPQNFTQRNKNILKAVKDGYTQSEIGRHLGLSRSTVSNIMKRKTKVIN
jgi:DNA-binding NarL/FixJ family response regulator